jgi:hypothetical protein
VAEAVRGVNAATATLYGALIAGVFALLGAVVGLLVERLVRRLGKVQCVIEEGDWNVQQDPSSILPEDSRRLLRVTFLNRKDVPVTVSREGQWQCGGPGGTPSAYTRTADAQRVAQESRQSAGAGGGGQSGVRSDPWRRTGSAEGTASTLAASLSWGCLYSPNVVEEGFSEACDNRILANCLILGLLLMPSPERHLISIGNRFLARRKSNCESAVHLSQRRGRRRSPRGARARAIFPNGRGSSLDSAGSPSCSVCRSSR